MKRVGKTNMLNLMNKKIKLNDLKVTSFVTEVQKSNAVKAGGAPNVTNYQGCFSRAEAICDTREPEFCNWTCNAWCHGSDNSYGAFCTAPK